MAETRMETPRTAIESDGALLVDWPDGHQSRLAPRSLRTACPCAACRDERESAGRLKVIQPIDPRAVTLARFESVGNYAITLVWQDGHRTGIYPYRLLRELCDCFACRLERG